MWLFRPDRIHHIDLYRLTGKDDLDMLCLERLYQTCGLAACCMAPLAGQLIGDMCAAICLIEWPDRLHVGNNLPKSRLQVEIADDGADSRTFSLEAVGDRWAPVLADISSRIQQSNEIALA